MYIRPYIYAYLAWRHQFHCVMQLQNSQNIWDLFLYIAAQGRSQYYVVTGLIEQFETIDLYIVLR